MVASARETRTVTVETPLLQVKNLRVSFGQGLGRVDAVRGVSFDLRRGETLGIVGESGSGKSTLAYAIMGYLSHSGSIGEGDILFKGDSLRDITSQTLRGLRGNRIAMVYQDPQTSLTPSIRIGTQIAEVLETHLGLRGKAATDRVAHLLGLVNLPDPASLMERYPHQLSGGQKQRILIAMALACDPDLLIMDEPTTGLDVTTEARILDLVSELKHRVDASILYISHNLGVIARVCDRVAVMYAGELVETSDVTTLFTAPRHPYTLGLLGSVPRLGSSKTDAPLQPIPGRIPASGELPQGCVFSPRCPYVRAQCTTEVPPLYDVGSNHRSRCFFWEEVDVTAPRRMDPPELVSATNRSKVQGEDPIIELVGVSKFYKGNRAGIFTRDHKVVKAVQDIDLSARTHETLAIVGESGCGKTTLSRVIAGLTDATSGQIEFDGESLADRAEQRPRSIRRRLQMVFQNPESSLNPRRTIGATLERPLEIMTDMTREQRKARVSELLGLVNLNDSYLIRYPKQLSGGEKQRVGIARAFAADPDLVICDEPVSALDVSVQAAILNLFTKLQQEVGTSYLFVAHDLGVVRYLADRIAVIYLGHIVELGTAEEVFAPPYHPYTEALLSAIPIPDPTVAQANIRLKGSMPNPADPPSGCPFHTRCPRKVGAVCETEEPPVQTTASGHRIWCHIPLAELEKVESIIQARSRSDSQVSKHQPAS